TWSKKYLSSEIKITVHLYCFKKISNHSIASESRWLVGSSNKSKVGFFKRSLPNKTLVFSPPERILIGLFISSSLKPKPFKTPLASDLYPYPFISENSSNLLEYSFISFSRAIEFILELSSEILCSKSLRYFSISITSLKTSRTSSRIVFSEWKFVFCSKYPISQSLEV